MTEATDRLDFCRQALAELGTRSTISALDPPDSSPESYYCNLFFEGTRDQVLRGAHWGFAGFSDTPILWKAAPGTPENPEIPENYIWSVRDPVRPWLYSYVYPKANIVQIRRVREQPQPGHWGRRDDECFPFEVATDQFDALGNYLPLTKGVGSTTIVSGGTGYRPGDYITLGGGGSVAANPAVLRVALADAAGIVQNAFVNNMGSYTAETAPAMPMVQLSTTGSGVGFSCTSVFAVSRQITVILTNARGAIYDSTTSLVEVIGYDPMFADAFNLALQGKLALALLGDRDIYKAKLQEANNAILEARVRDANEGLTTYDFVPDWLQVRGVSSMTPSQVWFNPPYGPLFAV